MDKCKMKHVWRRGCRFACLLFLAACLFSSSAVGGTAYAASSSQEEILGTAALDLNRTNFSAMDEDGTLYYCYDGGLYKQKTNSKGWSKFKAKSGKCLVSDCLPVCISIIDDDVYYVDGSDGKAYKVSTSGGKPTCILSNKNYQINALFVSQSYYFAYVADVNGANGSLVRINRSGKGDVTSLAINSVRQFVFLDGFLYYVQTVNGKDGVYKQPMDEEDWTDHSWYDTYPQKVLSYTSTDQRIEELTTDGRDLYVLLNESEEDALNDDVTDIYSLLDNNERVHSISSIDPATGKSRGGWYLTNPGEYFLDLCASDGYVYYIEYEMNIYTHVDHDDEVTVILNRMDFKEGTRKVLSTQTYPLEEFTGVFMGLGGMDNGYVGMYYTDQMEIGRLYFMDPDGGNAKTFEYEID